ncbi:MAG: hypothetical protein Q7S28_04125 [bacterium]|nr:hypothetical protein [bacterium]
MIIFCTALAVGFVRPVSIAAEKLTRTVEFDVPDIHDDFCGAQIDYRICKCARHNEMCKDIGRERSVANYILYSKYNAYVSRSRDGFKKNCESAGGRFGSDACKYYGKDNKEKECLPADFDKNWIKYSDIDERIPESERSFEAKKYAEAWGTVVKNTESAFVLQRDMEVDRLMRLEMRQYKDALVKNIKTNLLKAFWRLAWVTYDTTVGSSLPVKKEFIQGGAALGQTYSKLFDAGEDVVVQLGGALNIVRSLTPGDSKFAIDTEKTRGKFASFGLTGTLSTLENLPNPDGAYAVGTALFGEMAGYALPPKADITPEEIAILKDQHLTKGALDDVLQESYRVNRARRLEVERLKSENETLKSSMAEWAEKEKEHAKNNIIDSCEK